MNDYEDLQRHLSEGYERYRGAVLAAIESSRPPLDSWTGAVHAAVSEIDRIVRRNVHPDDVASARTAMSCLAGIWLDEDESEALYLNGREP